MPIWLHAVTTSAPVISLSSGDDGHRTLEGGADVAVGPGIALPILDTPKSTVASRHEQKKYSVTDISLILI
jgi:hypothetical protein